MKIFCIGDSRTGTTSLHYFLKAAGFKSIHHYEWVIEQSGASGADEKRNVFLAFIKESVYDAFTDHPTRQYYKEITNAVPDALIINTTARSPSQLPSTGILKVSGISSKDIPSSLSITAFMSLRAW